MFNDASYFLNFLFSEVDIYGRECFNNFDLRKTQRDEIGGGDFGHKKTYNYAEISESELLRRIDSNGQISFDISLPESKVTQKVSYSSDINSGDFIIKITKSGLTTPATIIKIPPQQMASSNPLENLQIAKMTMQRRSAGQDTLQYSIKHLQNLRAKSLLRKF